MDAADIEAIAAANRRDQYEAAQAVIAEFVASQPLKLAEVTTEAVYDVPPIRMVGEYTDHRLEQVRVRISRYPNPDVEEDQAGEVHVDGYLRPLNQDGRPRANGRASWMRLPKTLAAQLLMRALTES